MTTHPISQPVGGASAPGPRHSHSKSRLFRTCPRAFYYVYELGLQQRKNSAMRFGLAMHDAFEIRRKLGAGYGDLAFGQIDNAAIMRAGESVAEHGGDMFERERARAAMTAYCHRWKLNERYEIVSLEELKSAELVLPDGTNTGLTVRWKEDMLIRSEIGGLWLWESKTTSRPIDMLSTYWRKVPMDSQLCLYVYLLEQMGMRLSGIVYDVTKRPQIKPYKKGAKLRYNKDGSLRAGQRMNNETPVEFGHRVYSTMTNKRSHFSRGEVRIERHVIEDSVNEFWLSYQHTRSCRDVEIWPKTVDACNSERWGGGMTCPFLELCIGEKDAMDYPRRWTKLPLDF